MEPLNPETEQYLAELYRRTEGDAGAQVSMFDIGAAVGLEKEAARKLAEDLIAEGLVEIRTLSGGIGITAQGIDRAGPENGSSAGTGLSLGSAPVLEETGSQMVISILTEIKKRMATKPAAYASLEEMVIDIKTIEVQLLSPRPKTDVIKTVLNSLKDGLETLGAADLAGKTAKLIGA